MPAVVDTQASNADQGLVVLSLQGQNQRDDVADDHWVQVGKDLGMQHAMGETSYFGESSPYFNLNSNSSTTYGFIIGRNGIVRWRGSLGNKLDEYYEALAAALAAPELTPVTGDVSEDLTRTLMQMLSGDLGKAAREAQKVRDKSGKSSKPQAKALNEQATRLFEAFASYESGLIVGAREGLEASDGEAYARAARSLRASFPKSLYHKELKQLGKGLKQDPELKQSVDDWEAWLKLAASRPVTFPARKSKQNGRFARTLKKFVAKADGGPGEATASAWLARWEDE